MKIYTKKGDTGETSLYGGGKISKAKIRVDAFGSIDELNATLGVILSENFSKTFQNQLLKIQNQLFVLGAELAMPTEKLILRNGKNRLENWIEEKDILEIENWIDEQQANLPALTHFILPGGGRASAQAHVARTVCRRAERVVVSLDEHEKLRPEIIQYLNRLSDYFFTLARSLAQEAGVEETKWIP